MNRKTFLMFLGFLILPSQAFAGACDPPGSAQAAAKVTIMAISAKITAMSVAFVEILKLHGAQLTANIQALPGAFAKIAGAQTQSLSRIAQEGDEAQVVRDFTPSLAGCQNVTLANQLRDGERQKDDTHEQLNLKGHQQAHQSSSSPGAFTETVKARYAWRQEKYCGEGDSAAGLCKKKSILADGDVLAGETLLNKKTLQTKEQRQAAFDLTTTLLNPVPAEPLNAIQIQTPAGQEAWLMRKSREARHNLAHTIFSELMADREPLLEAKWMHEILSAQGNSGSPELPAKISRREFMDLEVKRRYENPQWYLDVQQMEPAELQRQFLHMTALLIKLIADQNRSLEHLAALQATQLAMTNEQTPPSLPSQTLSIGASK